MTNRSGTEPRQSRMIRETSISFLEPWNRKFVMIDKPSILQSAAQLTAVIQKSALHFCGDTGTLHLSLMTGTRSVSWFWPNQGIKVWAPSRPGCRTVMGENREGEQYLLGIRTAALVQAAQTVLDE